MIFSNMTMWYCEVHCRGQHLAHCQEDPVTRFLCNCDGQSIGSLVNMEVDDMESNSASSYVCLITLAKEEFSR